jgi:hypothetical protein
LFPSLDHLIKRTIQNPCKLPVSVKALYSFFEAGKDLAYHPTEYVLQRRYSAETAAFQTESKRLWYLSGSEFTLHVGVNSEITLSKN